MYGMTNEAEDQRIKNTGVWNKIKFNNEYLEINRDKVGEYMPDMKTVGEYMPDMNFIFLCFIIFDIFFSKTILIKPMYCILYIVV